MRRRFIYSQLICSLSTLGLLAVSALHAAQVSLEAASPPSVQQGLPLKAITNDFTGVAKKAIPAVVSIKVKEAQSSSFWGGVEGDENDWEGLGRQFWQRFFGTPFEGHAPPKPREGQGSGFLVSADGYIITNGHVVRDTKMIEVHLHDGRDFPAEVIGADSNTDIALLKINAFDLPYLDLGNSDQLQVGQWVLAIGTPLGLEATLSAGIVSAKGRNNLDLARVEDFIQTDASLYHGNSGGPLLNLDSEVVGINTAIASRMGGYIGIGFAIPSNIAKNVMDQLISKGSVSRGFIGVLLQDVTRDLAPAFGLNQAEGVIVAQVTKNSPAEKAGLRQGDVILSYNRHPVLNVARLRTAIAMMNPGTTLSLSIIRDKQPKELAVQIGEYAMADVATPQTEQLLYQGLGIAVGPLNPEAMEKLGLQDEKGVVVTKVELNSMARLGGVRVGNLILSINGQPTESVDAFYRVVRTADRSQPLLLLIKEKQGVRFVSFKVN